VIIRYIALEGVEGAGKSTVARALSDRLRDRGEAVVVVREPGGTAVGEEIRRLLLHADDMSAWAEAALFAAARAELVRQVVSPALEKGAVVISDRSYYSSLAYQGGGRGLGIGEVRALNEQVLGGIEPHLVVVLRVDPEVGSARESEVDRIGGGGLDFLRSVADSYTRLAAEDPRVVVVDASRPVDEVVDEVLEHMGSR